MICRKITPINRCPFCGCSKHLKILKRKRMSIKYYCRRCNTIFKLKIFKDCRLEVSISWSIFGPYGKNRNL